MGLSDDAKMKLQKQIQFYFSNSNIMGDKFLLGKVKENAEGWVELAVLLTFNKVKSQTTEVAELASALEGAEGLALNAEKTQVRRTEPLPESWNPLPRTIYAKGVPEEATHDELTTFFAKYGAVNKVSKRAFRGKDADGQKKFKRSVEVEFSTEEEAKKVLAEKLEYDGTVLEVMTKEAHDKEVAEKRAAAKKDGGAEESGDKKRKREEGDEAGEEASPKKSRDAPIELPKDATLKFTGIGELDWKVVKEAIKGADVDVRFCVIQDGAAVVMLGSKEECDKIVAKHSETPFAFGDVKPEGCEVLTGDAESAFREQMATKIAELRKLADGRKKGGKGKGKGGKGGKGGKKGRKGNKN